MQPSSPYTHLLHYTLGRDGGIISGKGNVSMDFPELSELMQERGRLWKNTISLSQDISSICERDNGFAGPRQIYLSSFLLGNLIYSGRSPEAVWNFIQGSCFTESKPESKTYQPRCSRYPWANWDNIISGSVFFLSWKAERSSFGKSFNSKAAILSSSVGPQGL